MSSEVVKGAFGFFSGTFLSRITGLIRDVSMAFCFGSHPLLAAFMVAYRLANVFRRLLGEGPFSSGLIPHFENIRQKSPRQGALFFRDVFFSVLFLLMGIVFIAEIFLLVWMRYNPLHYEISYAVFLMMPGILFICLYGICSAIVQCEKKFFLPSVAPVFFNFVWIAAVWLLYVRSSNQIIAGLSLAIVIGFFAQWVFLLPTLLRYLKPLLSFREIASFQFFSPDVKNMIKPLLLGLVGASAVQVNSALDAIFAHSASLEGPAYLWYAIRIEQLPIALFGIAFSSALLPSLSRLHLLGDLLQFRTLLYSSLSKGYSFIIPCMVALFALAVSGINLLYGRGNFDVQATKETVYCLWGYGLGLFPALGVLLITPAFYARKNFFTPMWTAFVSIASNVALNALFVFFFHWGAFSIAVSTSIASWVNLFLLVRVLKKQDLWVGSEIGKLCCKVGVCSLIAGGVCSVFGQFFLQDPTISLLLGKMQGVFPRQFFWQCLHFFVLSCVFFGALVAAAIFLKVEEISQIFKSAVRKIAA
jgi:putative peptidoglycan lipid II flippase